MIIHQSIHTEHIVPIDQMAQILTFTFDFSQLHAVYRHVKILSLRHNIRLERNNIIMNTYDSLTSQEVLRQCSVVYTLMNMSTRNYPIANIMGSWVEGSDSVILLSSNKFNDDIIVGLNTQMESVLQADFKLNFDSSVHTTWIYGTCNLVMEVC